AGRDDTVRAPASPEAEAAPATAAGEQDSLDFPEETKAHARGALLLDLPPVPGGSLDPPPSPDADVTRAASPSTLRKQVLSEPSRLDSPATAVGLGPARSDTTAGRGTQRGGEAAREEAAVDELTSDEENALAMVTTLPSAPPPGAVGEFVIPLFSD